MAVPYMLADTLQAGFDTSRYQPPAPLDIPATGVSAAIDGLGPTYGTQIEAGPIPTDDDPLVAWYGVVNILNSFILQPVALTTVTGTNNRTRLTAPGFGVTDSDDNLLPYTYYSISLAADKITTGMILAARDLARQLNPTVRFKESLRKPISEAMIAEMLVPGPTYAYNTLTGSYFISPRAPDEVQDFEPGTFGTSSNILGAMGNSAISRGVHFLMTRIADGAKMLFNVPDASVGWSQTIGGTTVWSILSYTTSSPITLETGDEMIARWQKEDGSKSPRFILNQTILDAGTSKNLGDNRVFI